MLHELCDTTENNAKILDDTAWVVREEIMSNLPTIITWATCNRKEGIQRIPRKKNSSKKLKTLRSLRRVLL